MNAQILIESTVRQITVLIAQIATSGGIRAPLAQVANQVFVELARELEAQGVSRKVSADMFGMALRAYIRKVRRLTEGGTDSGITLWQAVLDFIQKEGLVTRPRLLERFKHDGELEVSSIVRDLSDNGLIFSSGAGTGTVYRAASEDDLRHISRLGQGEGLLELAWALIFREGPLTADELASRLNHSAEETGTVIDKLEKSGRVKREGDRIRAEEFVIPFGATHGWEASVFDHVQAMVQTICQRLSSATDGARPNDEVGGSTYTFDIWPGHVHEAEVSRDRVEIANRKTPPPSSFEKITTYVGQCVVANEPHDSDDEEKK